LKWISSTGGPLIVVPQEFAHAWRGQDSESGHYELASEVDYAAIVDASAGEDQPFPVLVLWDEPLDTAFDDEWGIIIQWRFAESEADLLDLVSRTASDAQWEAVGSTTGYVAWQIFDAADNGDEVDAEASILVRLDGDVLRAEVVEVQGNECAARLIRLSS
jgi:hypothetical protein